MTQINIKNLLNMSYLQSEAYRMIHHIRKEKLRKKKTIVHYSVL